MFGKCILIYYRGYMKFYFYMFMTITLIFDVLGDFFAKKWSIDNHYVSLVLLIFFYATSGVLWGLSLKHAELSKGTLIINLLNVLIMIIIGVALYKEDLTLQNKIGLVLGIISLWMVNR